MVKNKTRQKPVNAWVSLCLVTKRLANWGELLSGRSGVRITSGTPAHNARSSCKSRISGFSCVTAKGSGLVAKFGFQMSDSKFANHFEA